MNLNTVIHDHILAPKYLKIYHLIEALGNTKIERFKQDYVVKDFKRIDTGYKILVK